MPFVKVVKNKAYFKRFQTKYRRRREGKTDYYARRKLIVQAKNKYNSPKYRFVVRLTNQHVICQVVYSAIDCDRVLAAAYSSELKRYGLTVGLKNYAAAYATGLLAGRRVLKRLGLDQLYEGNKTINGEVVSTEMNNRTFFVASINDEKRPFRALLDVGIRPTTTGARIFGALKGGADSGIDIPHSEKRFPGYDRKEKKYDASIHRDRIFGGHVAKWMESLSADNEEEYKSQFACYIAAGLNKDNLEALYKKVHAAIRANPDSAHAEPASKRAAGKAQDKKYANRSKMSRQQREDRVRQKKAHHAKTKAAAGGDAESEDGSDSN